MATDLAASFPFETASATTSLAFDLAAEPAFEAASLTSEAFYLAAPLAAETALPTSDATVLALALTAETTSPAFYPAAARTSLPLFLSVSTLSTTAFLTFDATS